MRPTSKNAHALAESLGIDLEVTQARGYFDAMMWAPKGFVLADTGCHCSVLNADAEIDGQMPSTKELWAEVIARLSDGLEPCTDPECDYCTGED